MKYAEGEKLPWGMLTVVGPVMYEGERGEYFSGRYLLQCACGSEPFEKRSTNITTALANKANSIYSCGCTRLPRKSSGRSPHYVDCRGMTIGRLVVIEWAGDGKGWECVCSECEQVIYLPTLKLLEGIRPCKAPCVEKRLAR